MEKYSPEAVAEIRVADIEIEQLTTVFRHRIDRLELGDLAGGIGHVRQIQSVVVGPENEPTTSLVRGWVSDDQGAQGK